MMTHIDISNKPNAIAALCGKQYSQARTDRDSFVSVAARDLSGVDCANCLIAQNAEADAELAQDAADAKQYAAEKLDKLCDELEELLEAAQSARMAVNADWSGDELHFKVILKDAKRVFQNYRIKGDALAAGHGVVAAIEEIL